MVVSLTLFFALDLSKSYKGDALYLKPSLLRFL